MSDLHESLRRTADDTLSPVTTDVGALLGRAQEARARSRQRIGGVAALAVAAVIGTAFGVQTGLAHNSAESSEGQAADGAGLEQVAPPTPDQVIARCLPQLSKYSSYPMYADNPGTTDWALGHPRRAYQPGDVVTLIDSTQGSNPVLCLLPEKGQESDPVPFDAFRPKATDKALIHELCSESVLPQPQFDSNGLVTGSSVDPGFDLDDATVQRVAAQGSLVEAVMVQGESTYDCLIQPVTWDLGGTQVSYRSPSYDVEVGPTGTGGGVKSITPDEGTYYTAGGRMPVDAATIEVDLPTGTRSSKVVDGYYAFAFQTDGPINWEVPYRVLDAAGRVLAEG